MSSPCIRKIVSSLEGLFFCVLFLFNVKGFLSFFFSCSPTKMEPVCSEISTRPLCFGRKPQEELPLRRPLLDAFRTWRGRTDVLWAVAPWLSLFTSSAEVSFSVYWMSCVKRGSQSCGGSQLGSFQ